MANQLVHAGLRISTRRSYASAQGQYAHFCAKYGLCPVPATDTTVLRFIAFGHTRNWSPNTMQVYISAISALHKLNGYKAPDLSGYQLKLALRAYKQHSPATKHCHPITIQLLTDMIHLLHGHQLQHLWSATLTLGYFAALRGAEYTATPCGGSTCTAPTVSQLSFTIHKAAPAMRLTLNTTKTSNEPVPVFIGCSKNTVCAVCMMTSYLQLRATLGPILPSSYLLAFPDGRPVNKFQLNSIIKQLITKLGLNAAQYTSHSLRAGAATMASRNGLSDVDIKKLGHWASEAYQTYIHKDTDSLFSYAARLT